MQEVVQFVNDVIGLTLEEKAEIISKVLILVEETVARRRTGGARFMFKEDYGTYAKGFEFTARPGCTSGACSAVVHGDHDCMGAHELFCVYSLLKADIIERVQ